MLLLEQVLVLAAQGHQRRHVDLVEGREHGGGVLRILEAPRDGLAQLGHFHAFFARSVVGGGRRADGDGRGRGGAAAGLERAA